VTNKLALIVAVILGVLSVIGINAYVDKVRDSMRSPEDELTYLVAARDVEEGEVFTANDIKTASFRRETIDDALRGSHIKDRERQSILGARTRAKIREGQILQTHHFHRRTQLDSGPKFGKEHRAITIPVSRTIGVGGMLKPGDYIDLVVSLELTDDRGQPFPTTLTLFKSVMILATDTNTDPHAVTRVGYQTLTLRLTPPECNTLLHCLNQGASFHCLLVQEGTSPRPGYDPVTTDQIYREVKADLNRRK